MTSRSLPELVASQLEVASLSGEVEAVMQGIVDRLMELPGADGASLSTIEDEFACFKVTAGEDGALHGRTLLLSETLGYECLRNPGVTVLRASLGPEVARCLTPGACAILMAPITYDGSARGILGVRSADVDAFSPDDVETIELLARSAAVALRNAELVERLARSEEQYRTLHSQAADATLVGDADGNVLDANDAAAALLWYSVDELRTMQARDLFATDGVEAHHEELQRRREVRSERPFVRKDGTIVHVEYSTRLLDDGRVHTTLRDATQRKRNDERLRESLERLHEIVETQHEISMLELDPESMSASIAERAQRLADADGAAVLWFEDEDSICRIGQQVKTGETVYIADTTIDSRFDGDARDGATARSLICAPLYRDGEVAGVLSIYGSLPDAFDDLAVETTRLMAEFVSTVFRNAAELETRRQLVEELQTQGQVVEHMHSALWILRLEPDRSFRLEYANAASERATTLTTAEIVGHTLEEVLPALDPGVSKRLRRVVAERVLVDNQEMEYGDERVAPSIFTMKAFPLTGDRVAVTFENVTDIVRAQRALQESESRFRGAFQSSSVGMALTALDGAFIEVNERLAEMLGYTVEELTPLGVPGITHPEDMQQDFDFVKEMRAGTRDSFSRRKRYIRKDGSLVWADLSVSLVRTYEGEPSHVVSHVHDVTESMETSLLFESMFENSVVPKVIADDEQRIVDLNHAATELIGVPHTEALKLTLRDLLQEQITPRGWRAFRSRGKLDAEVTLYRPDGGTRRIEFVATSDVRPGRHIAVVRDLTRQKELESQLRQAQKMEAVGRLAGGIAHDFNNLLTAISGYSEFLEAGIEDPRLKRHAEEIKKAASRAASLTGQLLAFSRRQVLQPRILDLNAVVEDMDSLLRRLIGEDIELVAVLHPAVHSIRADPTQLEQVIVNLAVNARDSMPSGGSLLIETANYETGGDSFVELRMTDTGIGMTPEERRQLFDPFFTTKDGGTGLGLATVYGIVEQSGGSIEVDSAPGLGSSFRIRLPWADTAAPVDPTLETRGPPQPPQGGTETILLVEDEAIVRRLVAEILEAAGYNVLQAADGPSALELLRRHALPIGMLLTDVVMPGMSGPEVAKAVTAMRPGTQVLYTSGYTNSQIDHHGVLEPGIAFLQKPFTAADLTGKVRSLLDEPAVA
jgi:PAS domain S-box-containing protein